MGICPTELLKLVIRPTLEYLGDYSEAAENLLLATAAMESQLGFHIAGEASGLGVYQIHPRSHQRLWDRYLAQDPDLASRVRGLASQHEFLSHPHEELATNLRYATAIAWMMYKRKNKPLPVPSDIEAMGKYWRRHFHSRPHGSVNEFVARYQSLVDNRHLAA